METNELLENVVERTEELTPANSNGNGSTVMSMIVHFFAGVGIGVTVCKVGSAIKKRVKSKNNRCVKTVFVDHPEEEIDDSVSEE